MLEKTFAFQKDCEAAARASWQAAQQKGAFGCGEYSATSFANGNRRSPSRTSPDEQFGEKFRRSEQEQQARERKAQQEAESRNELRAREAAREQARRQYMDCMRDRGPC